MRKLLFLTAAVCLFATAAFSQKSDYSGTWTLDVSKSKLGERNSIESQTLTVVQTDKDIKVTTATKRAAPPAGAPAGGPPPGGGGGRMGGGMGGDTTNTYTLDGKETTVEVDSPMGKTPVKFTGKRDAGKLILSSSRTISNPNGEVTITTKETWSLSADGTTLTVDGESTSPRGTNTTQKVFVKKS
jgi:hypothetical protein